jgi:hypothetical protein
MRGDQLPGNAGSEAKPAPRPKTHRRRRLCRLPKRWQKHPSQGSSFFLPPKFFLLNISARHNNLNGFTSQRLASGLWSVEARSGLGIILPELPI